MEARWATARRWQGRDVLAEAGRVRCLLGGGLLCARRGWLQLCYSQNALDSWSAAASFVLFEYKLTCCVAMWWCSRACPSTVCVCFDGLTGQRETTVQRA